MSNVDKGWHLAKTDNEMRITDFELILWRVFNGFMRWVEGCESYANESSFNGYELSILHIIRAKDTPKSINEIGLILNRNDFYNIKYTIRKLLKMGLIEKLESSPKHKKSSTYQITKEGIKNTDHFVETRRKILMDIFSNDAGETLTIEDITETISKFEFIYDKAEKTALSKTTEKMKRSFMS